MISWSNFLSQLFNGLALGALLEIECQAYAGKEAK